MKQFTDDNGSARIVGGLAMGVVASAMVLSGPAAYAETQARPVLVPIERSSINVFSSLPEIEIGFSTSSDHLRSVVAHFVNTSRMDIFLSSRWPVVDGAYRAVSNSLQGIAALEDGWWGEGSRPVSERSLSLVSEALPRLFALAPDIAIAPHPSGILVLEWAVGSVDYTAELDGGREIVYTSDNRITDALAEQRGDATVEALVQYFEALNR